MATAPPLKAIGSKRGKGACSSCHTEYANRTKPKFCECGYELGGNFVPKAKKKKEKPCPPSVEIWKFENRSFYSVKLTPGDDRNFVLTESDNQSICYQPDCKKARSSVRISGMNFECKHINRPATQPEYAVSFSDEEIINFTPDRKLAAEMSDTQTLTAMGDTVVKVSRKSYAVKSRTSSTSEMGYIHVKEVEENDQKTLKCMANECRKKFARTKQVCSIFFYKNGIVCRGV